MTTQRKTSSPASPHWPRHALGHACLLALAGFSSAALAQTTGAALSVTNASVTAGVGTETTGAVWSANYSLVTGESQFGSGMLDASNTGVLMGSSLTGGGAVPVAVSNNTLQSLAFGNQTSSGSGLSLLTGSLLSMNLQSLSGLIQPGVDPAPDTIGSLSVSAVIDSSSAFITQSGMDSADLALTGNTLEAGTQLNVADIRVAGVTPSGYVSTAKASSTVAFSSDGAAIGSPDTPTAGSTGSVNLSNLQSTFSASPSATVSDSSVALTVSGTTVVGEEEISVFANAASVNDNTLSASTGINTGTSIFQAEAGSAAWNGSVSVTNLQNAAAIDGTTDSLASVSGSTISADLRNGTDQTDLTGSLTLNENQISANSTGNSAGARTTSGAVSAGNAITFEGGADITGSGSGTGTSVALASGTAQSVADLTLVNAQANAASSFTTSVTGGDVISNTDNLAGGTLTQSGNAITASSTANLAGNLVSAGQGGSVANFSASVAALNVQSNAALNSTASVEDSAVSAVVGIAGAVPTGTVTLSGNTLAATAEGNVGVTTVALKAANLTVSGTLGANPTQGVTLNADAGTASSSLGVVALSVQSNEGGSLTANNEGTSVSLSFDNQAATPLDVGIAAMSATLSGNRLQSTATANSASNSATLEGTNGTGLSAAVGNSQRNTDMAVLATAGSSTTPLAVSLTAGNVVGSTLTLNDNTLSAEASGNTASNRLKTTLVNASGSAQLFESEGGVAPSASAYFDGGASVLTDLALGSAQVNVGGSLTSDVAGSVALAVGEVSGDTRLNLSNNTIGANTTSNSASNAMELSITNMTGMTAGVASAQTLSGSNTGASTTGLVSVDALSLDGSSATVGDNAIAASVFGNSASNTLSLAASVASGRSVVPSVSVGGSTTEIVDSSTGAGDFVVANNQQIDGTIVDPVVLSSLTGGTVKISTGTVGAVDPATLTLSGNSVSAYTGANSATNRVALNVGELSAASAGVASRQVIELANVTSLTTGSVLLEGGAITGSALTLNENMVKSTSLGNVANNQVSVAGTNATGSDGTVASAASASAGTAANVVADIAVANLQNSNDITLSATTTGDVGMALGAVSDGSALTLTKNTIGALAQSNSATNTLALASTNLTGMSAGVASSQATDGTVDATAQAPVTGAFSIVADSAANTPVVLSNNAFSAVAGMNEAFNTLSAAGASLLGRGGSPASLVGDASTTASTTGVDFSVVNAQSGVGSVSALADPGTIGFTGSLTGGSLSITGNTVLARASVNTASNELTLAATSSLAATAVVNNVQEMDSLVTATVVDSANAPSLLGAALTAGGASTVAVSDNRVTARATGNLASNALNATALSGISSSGSTALPTFAVLNQQRTQGSIEAELNGTNLGAALNGTGGSTSVQGNQMVALAYGNSVDNVISMSALPGSLNTASAAITNVQYNMASITATVSGASMVASGTVSGAGSVNVSGNTITAQVVGNRSVNSITAAR